MKYTYVDMGVLFCVACNTQLGLARDNEDEIHEPTDCIAKLANKIRYLSEDIDELWRKMGRADE